MQPIIRNSIREARMLGTKRLSYMSVLLTFWLFFAGNLSQSFLRLLSVNVWVSL